MSERFGRKRPEVGDRVGAILYVVDEVAKFFGYGVYAGDFVPQEAVGFFAKWLIARGITNPCLKLDSGKKVYGCECWWGHEEEIREVLDACLEVEEVDIDQVRAAGRVAAAA